MKLTLYKAKWKWVEGIKIDEIIALKEWSFKYPVYQMIVYVKKSWRVTITDLEDKQLELEEKKQDMYELNASDLHIRKFSDAQSPRKRRR